MVKKGTKKGSKKHADEVDRNAGIKGARVWLDEESGETHYSISELCPSDVIEAGQLLVNVGRELFNEDLGKVKKELAALQVDKKE